MTQNNHKSNPPMSGKQYSQVLLILLLCLLGGCSNLAEEPINGEDAFADDPIARFAFPLPNEAATEASLVRQKLYQQYVEWKGVPYRENSASKTGTDCSGYVVETFRQQFDIALPRSSDEQAELGEEVDVDELQEGDLVFFKTGFWLRHVGIYLEKGLFMHASTSKGVVISRLDDAYWSDAYWQARRISLGKR